MQLNIQKDDEFPFDLGRAFYNLTAYLTKTDKLSLASTCHLLQNIIYRADTWHQFELHDFELPTLWGSYLQWAQKYIDIIQPTELSISILSEKNEKDKNLLRLFLKQRVYVKRVEIRCCTDLIHLAVAHSCPTINSLTLHSSFVSDSLLQTMVKHCPQIKDIEINTDSLEFTCLNMVNYLKSPLERLVLKPYQLDYAQIIKLLEDQNLNQVNELEIDVEECDQILLPKITSHLPYIKKLRLFHMQKFFDQQSLAKNMTSQISELTLTKCYKLELDSILSKISSENLLRLDLTESLLLKDQQLMEISQKATKLKWVNISWCNQVTNLSVARLVARCLILEGLVVNGIKALNDYAFAEYNNLKDNFNEKLYDEIRFQFKKRSKHNKQKVQQVYQALEAMAEKIIDIGPRSLKTLTNLRHLQCISCNNISDTLLKIIYSSNRMAKVTNYYGQVLSLYYLSEFSDDQF